MSIKKSLSCKTFIQSREKVILYDCIPVSEGYFNTITSKFTQSILHERNFFLYVGNTGSWYKKITFEFTYQSRLRTDLYTNFSTYNKCHKITTVKMEKKD